LIVEGGNKAAARPVELLQATGTEAVVSGVRAGEQGTVDGQHTRSNAPAMNLSELFIRRPVMTVLLTLAIVVAGGIAYSKIPVSALPSYNTPVINVSAALPGASPETMATSVALQLEKQFQTIPGLPIISSTNTLGPTSVTLEFEQGRDIDAAAVDVQAALLRAQRTLPVERTVPPSYRKVSPADAPVLFIWFISLPRPRSTRPTSTTMPNT
jgi:multidrug efflux pump subunit AcrB